MCTRVVADMASDNLGAMNLTGSSNVEMDDSVSQNDAVTTYTNHTGGVSFIIVHNAFPATLPAVLILSSFLNSHSQLTELFVAGCFCKHSVCCQSSSQRTGPSILLIQPSCQFTMSLFIPSTVVKCYWTSVQLYHCLHSQMNIHILVKLANML